MASNEFASFMWIWIRGYSPLPRGIYITCFYFPPASSPFFIHGDLARNPYLDLYIDIFQYSTMGEVILLGDFNAHTKALQIPLHDRSQDMFCIEEMNFESVGLHRLSEDALGPITAYGRQLLQLGESHELLILNDLSCFPDSFSFTCFPHSRGAGVYYAIFPKLLFFHVLPTQQGSQCILCHISPTLVLSCVSHITRELVYIMSYLARLHSPLYATCQ